MYTVYPTLDLLHTWEIYCVIVDKGTAQIDNDTYKLRVNDLTNCFSIKLLVIENSI